MDDGAQDVDVADDDTRDRQHAAPARRRGLAWLFERRPERSDRTRVADEPAELEPVEDEPVEDEPVEDEPVEDEPVEDEHASLEAATDPEPAEDDTGDSDGPVSLQKAPEAPKARPRPSGSAPRVYEPAASTATEPTPGESFFSRPVDADDEKWHKDADKDEARAEREERRKKRRSAIAGALRSLRKLVIIVGVVVVAALLLRNYVAAPYYVPSASMEPTLHGCPGCNNDHVLVEKLSYRFHDVQAGDIVVFHRPDTWKVPDDVLIKRVIGVAGDRLTIRNGRVYRNGQVLAEPYVNQACKPATTASPGSTSRAAKRFKVVPTGDVFVMGDNRCDSEDSRVFGVVPTSKIIGRAFMIVYPFGRLHSL